MTVNAENKIESSDSRIKPHSALAKFAHWGFIAVYIYAVFKQVDEVEELENVALLREEFILASVFLGLLIARFVYMRLTRPTALPHDTPANMMLMARIVHFGLYASMAMIAITGIIIGSLYYGGVKSGLVMDAVLLLHEIMFWTSINLIALHIVAAFYHRYKGDGIWEAMLPDWKSQSQQNKSSV